MTHTLRNQAILFAAAALLAGSACKKAEKKQAEPAAETETAGKTTAPETIETPPEPVAAGPTIKSYTASEQGFLVGSYAVVDGGEILLIDTQLIKPEVEKFIELVKGLETSEATIACCMTVATSASGTSRRFSSYNIASSVLLSFAYT